ncbi:MAG: RluA family pseudouridine synthase [Desulfarculaceae bacterium]|nr:RluA family pseudouridine synthase [Desulfarculaceae bacterium]MCF8047587.1 RluA family pseudouridine synthase [Desulfarculaceae bacterium]MCF8064818.1 RluA family pseudouridine synthase [Desulfarculaceae bacterium]MCF8123408.1 RluA family pseudouridine synthase [Desulfarculaceae bacterium]
MKQHQLEVPSQSAGQRLDALVAELLGPELSRAQVQRLLKEGRVTLEGRPVRASAKVQPGQAIVVQVPDPEPLELAPEDQGLWVLYEDADLIVVNKAAGVVVHPAAGHTSGTLVAGLLHHCGDLSGIGGKLRPGIVHRLDKDTSGALVAAKSEAAHRGLVAAFAAGRVDKTYLALVHGRPPLSGEASSPIGRHPVDRKRMSTHARHGKSAVSRWRVTRRFGQEASLLRVNILTGRTHQIRVHLFESGFPVCGDRTYGGRRARAGLPGQAGLALKAAGRQMLHAALLAFDHPVSGGRVEVTAPLPEDFRAVLRSLEAAYA